MDFLRIDKALSEYYAAMGHDHYYDSHNEGRFIKYCEENELQEDDIEEEFANTAADCMYIGFDDDFPLNPPTHDTEQRQKEIFRILKHCHQHGTPPSIKDLKMNTDKTTLNIFDLKINTDKETQIQCDKLYRKQCPLLYKGEVVLRRCYSIWMENNRYPFLIHLVDSYLRDKALYQYEEDKELQTVKWKRKSRYFHKLHKKRSKMVDTLIAAVQTYLRRGCHSWIYGPSKLLRIQDSMRDITSYIYIFYQFKENLIQENQMITPFQMDITIALHKVKAIKMMSNVDESEIDSDASDSDDEKEYNVDCIGDIQMRLNANNLPHYAFEIKHDLSATKLVSRDINEAFHAFSNILSHKNYPQQRRFCVFIDRRDYESHKVVFFVPSDCDEIPQNHVPEWYLNASKTCIIPEVQNIHTVIGADTQTNGQLMTISYHIEAIDCIRVYMHWMGRYTRLYPQDLAVIFPDIFDIECCDNHKWDPAILNKMEFHDAAFEAFYDNVSYKNHRKKSNDSLDATSLSPRFASAEELLQYLTHSHLIDVQLDNGQYVLCTVIEKDLYNEYKILLHPASQSLSATKHNKYCYIHKEYMNLSRAKSAISTI